MKGDTVKALVRTGTGSTSVEMEAEVGGRSVAAGVEKDSGISWLVLRETTRGGTVTRECRIQMPDVIYWEKVSG